MSGWMVIQLSTLLPFNNKEAKWQPIVADDSKEQVR